jgi:transposase-like protein
VERWKESGLTAKEFSAEMGVNPSTLTFWSWKLRNERGRKEAQGAKASNLRRGVRRAAAGVGRSEGRFVEVTAEVVGSSSPVLEVVLGSGVHVRVPEDFQEATLTRVLRAVEAAQ